MCEKDFILFLQLSFDEEAPYNALNQMALLIQDTCSCPHVHKLSYTLRLYIHTHSHSSLHNKQIIFIQNQIRLDSVILFTEMAHFHPNGNDNFVWFTVTLELQRNLCGFTRGPSSKPKFLIACTDRAFSHWLSLPPSCLRALQPSPHPHCHFTPAAFYCWDINVRKDIKAKYCVLSYTI